MVTQKSFAKYCLIIQLWEIETTAYMYFSYVECLVYIYCLLLSCRGQEFALSCLCKINAKKSSKVVVAKLATSKNKATMLIYFNKDLHCKRKLSAHVLSCVDSSLATGLV